LSTLTIPELEAELKRQRDLYDEQAAKCVEGSECHCPETKAEIVRITTELNKLSYDLGKNR